MLFPSRAIFSELARQGNLIPVFREIVADFDTPVSALLKIDTGDYSFLLESVEHGTTFSRYSFLGANPSMIFTARGSHICIEQNGSKQEFATDADPLAELQKLMARYRPINFGQLPIFYGGAIGYLSFEAVTHFEKTVRRAAKDDLQIPDACFMITDTLIIFDHLERRIKILANAHVTDDPMASYDEAVKKIDQLQELLERAVPHQVLRIGSPLTDLEPSVNMTQDEYVQMVAKMQEFIRSGDIFQVVPSQRFETPYTGMPMDLYRALRLINPSPYMFCLRMPGLALVGSSPEVHVRCEQGCVTIRPIAGTRPRKANVEEDNAMAHELLADPKECAEHLMLVDLARNDVGRVCDFNSVRVTDFMSIERYSHVMHIVSNVEGRLRSDCNAYDVMRATFPAGTVSGAPKVRALQIISELEPTCRGSYAGAIGYFGFSGNLDSCIGIRTALLKDGKAYIQAGGGLVADSTPMGEYQESVNKAKAALKALALAKTFEGAAVQEAFHMGA